MISLLGIVALCILGLLALMDVMDVRDKRRVRRTPCARCGATGSTQRFNGSRSQPNFYREDLLLCDDCSAAHADWLENLFLLQTERQFGFGRGGMIREAEAQWGNRATEILALLMVAEQDIDRASRVLTPASFAKVRPWIEEKLREAPRTKPPRSKPRQAAETGDPPSDGLGLKLGQRVTIIDGPFVGTIATVRNVTEREGTVRLEISVFGRSHTLTLKRPQVAPI